jgi:hypothetical protein
MTAGDLIARALRAIGALAQGETPTAAEAADALATLNDLIDSWGAHRHAVYRVERATFDLVAGAQDYTIGTWVGGGSAPNTHFEHVRPVWVDHASVLDPTGSDVLEEAIEVYTTVERWQQIPIKDVASDPTELYVEAGWPYTTLHVYPVPDTSDLDLVLYLPVAVAQFADLSSDYTFPNGYADALRYNLALRLAPEYGRPVDPVIAGLAAESLATIKRANAPVYELSLPSELVGEGTFDWRTGE